MHHLVFIIKVLGESTCGYVLNLTFKDFRYGIAHLLQDVQEEHKLVLSLLAICHVFSQLFNRTLQVLILLHDLSSLFTLLLQLATVPIKDQFHASDHAFATTAAGSLARSLVRSFLHLLFEHDAGPLLMLEYLLLQLFYLVVSFINLTGHGLDMAPCLILISL